jgi:hypothetical protein
LFFARSLLAYLVTSYLGDTVQCLGKLRVAFNRCVAYAVAGGNSFSGC